jgi:predicted short-subunit dehydrogenase-like oxidoreductase (DUF2520 family)
VASGAPFPAVAVVGAGAVGTALAHALEQAGIRVVAVASRTEEHAQNLASSLPDARVVSLAQAGAAAPLVVLSVSDSAIEAAAASIGEVRGGLIVHTSGSRSVDALANVLERGGSVGGFHPLAAVVKARAGSADAAPAEYAAVFKGAAFAIEGERPIQTSLELLARALGGHPFPIAAADKPLYHLGASMLAAFAAGLGHITWEQMKAAGASSIVANRGVAHLLRTVANNLERAPSPAHALTGPVARGDAGGVLRQAAAAALLSAEAGAVYRVHVAHNVRLARGAGRIDDATADRLLRELKEQENPANATTDPH